MASEDFLRSFIETEDDILSETLLLQKGQGLDFNVAPTYMEQYFQEFDCAARPTYRPLAPDIPSHISELEIHSKGEAVFDDAANMCLMRMGYFFGCCLLKESAKLYWAVGGSETALSGQPVIAGFNDGTECPVVKVCENVVRRISDDRANYGNFLTVYDVWRKLV